MRKMLILLSACALATLVIVPMLYYFGRMNHDQMKHTLTAATILWFATSIFWMDRRHSKNPE